MQKKTKLFWCLCLLFTGALAQESDWIDFNQSYIKLKVAEDGFYRVSSLELQNHGFPAGSVSASKVRIYRRGEEIAIRRNTASDGILLESIDFYAQRNDGKGDEALYLPNSQPHQYVNLFTDTATYFLTWTADNSNRTIEISNTNDPSGLTPDAYHLAQAQTLNVSTYSGGRRFGSDNALQLAEYDRGEGWTGPFSSKNQRQDYSYSLIDTYSSGPEPVVEIVAIGGNSLDHLVDISASPDGTNFTSIGTINFLGYVHHQHLDTIPWDLVGTGGELNLRFTVLGQANAADRVSFSAITIDYPQELTVNEPRELAVTAKEVDRSYLRIGSAIPNSFEIFDVTDPVSPIYIPGTKFSDRIDIITTGSQQVRELVAIDSYLSVQSISSYSFNQIDLAGKDFLIISHPLLHSPVDGVDPVQAYADYRSSSEGGLRNVEIAQIDDVYDQFNYGDQSSLAIKQMLYAGRTTLKDVFIIGKGRTVNQNFYRRFEGEPAAFDSLEVMVPTYGLPGGDQIYSIGLEEPLLNPSIPIGRLNARTPKQVADYLDKVREIESLSFDALWRKDLVQLSGGQSSFELDAFAKVISTLKRIAEDDFLGGYAQNQGKTSSDESQFFPINEEVNAGVSLLTLFGHSSNTVTDIEIGRVSDPRMGYANKGKYPIILVNGCKAGEIFGNSFSFGEDWMLTPELGSVGFIAHADFALSSNLRRYSNLFYLLGFATDSTFASTVGENIINVADWYFEAYGTDDASRSQIYQMLYQGDPSLKIFGGDKPDYVTTDDDINSSPYVGDLVLANQDSFKLEIVVRNYSRTVKDGLQVGVKRTLPSGEIINYNRFFESVRRLDTITFPIRNFGREVTGINDFEITIDPGDSIPELDDLNNQARYQLNISKGNTINLLPLDQSVLSGDTVRLTWQPTDVLQLERGYAIEISTDSDFESAVSHQVSGENFMVFDFLVADLSLTDSSTVFWRTRFANPETENDSLWATSSFTYLDAEINGWGQFELEVFQQNQFTGLQFDPSGQMVFEETSIPLSLHTMGTEVFDYDELRVLIGGVDFLATSNTIDPVCRTNTINFLAFDKVTSSPYRPIPQSGADVYNPLICGRLPQMIFNLTESYVFGADRYLDSLIASTEIGDKVALFSFDSVSYSNWDSRIVTSLGEIGVDPSQVASLVDGQPLIIYGEKGAVLGSAIVVADDGTILPPKQKAVELDTDVVGKYTEGRVKSGKIGPAKQWQSLEVNFDQGGDDQVEMTVFGVTQDGVERALDLLATGGRTESSYDLSGVDPDLYPYIRLQAILSDETNQTPAQFDNWTSTYVNTPAGILNINDKSSIELQEGETISVRASYVDIGVEAFTDSLDVAYSFVNLDNELTQVGSQIIPAPAPGDSSNIEFELSSVNHVGTNNLRLSVTPRETELYSPNNSFLFKSYAEITADDINPVLEVTFDGKHIMDGEIVSAEPNILVRMKDENRVFYKKDTVGIELSVKRPGDLTFEKVLFTDPEIEWTPATEDQDFEVTYRPKSLEDGVYSLRAQAQDESGNQSAEKPYEVSFEIVNESTITHFYPYPNPFSTSCRFVFTLTGSEVPDQLLIQIMTISGRVVREITQDEIGSLSIGNNISQYAWDGRDEFGDQLANGVYLYKVSTRINGESIEHRATSADQAFTKGYGKLYILR